MGSQVNPEVQLFLETLKTAADIDEALDALASVETPMADDAICRYAAVRGFNFSSEDANRWISEFHQSIADTDLRSRWHRCRFRAVNQWAAFLMLERDMKIDLPEEQFIGNPWLIDDEEGSAAMKKGCRLSILQRCQDFLRWRK